MSPNTPRETILLVDDDEQVRALALEVLRQQGYIVLEAASGEEALRLADESGHGKIHLLLTDVDLPSLNGPETARRTQASRPKIKVLYISGNYRAVTELGLRSDTLLRKPFTMAELVQRVRSALDLEAGC